MVHIAYPLTKIAVVNEVYGGFFRNSAARKRIGFRFCRRHLSGDGFEGIGNSFKSLPHVACVVEGESMKEHPAKRIRRRHPFQCIDRPFVEIQGGFQFTTHKSATFRKRGGEWDTQPRNLYTEYTH